MTGFLRAFQVVMGLGIVVNLLFIVAGLVAPDVLLMSMGLPPNETAFPWIGNAAMLLIQASVFYLPIVARPERYAVFAWLAVFSRFAVALYWLSLWSGPDGEAFRSYFFTDFGFALVSGVLLQLGLPREQKLGAQLRALGRGIASPFRHPLFRWAAVAVLVLFAVVGYWAWANLIRKVPDVVFDDSPQQFEHGAIGLGATARIPYWIFRVMPEVCKEHLPGGWASVGLLFEEGQDLPVGFAKRQIGFTSAEPNCALCHTGSYRTSPEAERQLILGGPAHELDLQSLQRFLYACVADPDFDAANVLREAAKITDLPLGERLAYRFVLVPFTKAALSIQGHQYAWQNARPPQGRGRADTFNPTKINVFHMPDDGTIGTVDLPATWNQRPREGLWLHWDGNNNAIRERNYAAAMAIGATPRSVQEASFKAVTDFLLDLPPPEFPFEVDADKAARGKVLFDQHCASCHAFGQPKTGQVTPIGEIGTDRHRLDSFTPGLVERFHEIDDPPFVFDAYRKTDGYANLPIDGTWARAPYLHNGSVPTLWDLLLKPEQRPRLFYTGYNVYDPVKMGFVTSGPEAERVGFPYDVSIPGNGNQGHLFGTDLAEAEKWDLIEYLKTY